MLQGLYEMWVTLSEAFSSLLEFFQLTPAEAVSNLLESFPGVPSGVVDWIVGILPSAPLYVCLIGGAGAFFIILKLVVWIKKAVLW